MTLFVLHSKAVQHAFHIITDHFEMKCLNSTEVNGNYIYTHFLELAMMNHDKLSS